MQLRVHASLFKEQLDVSAATVRLTRPGMPSASAVQKRQQADAKMVAFPHPRQDIMPFILVMHRRQPAVKSMLSKAYVPPACYAHRVASVCTGIDHHHNNRHVSVSWDYKLLGLTMCLFVVRQDWFVTT
jgi:hypothetical protein